MKIIEAWLCGKASFPIQILPLNFHIIPSQKTVERYTKHFILLYHDNSISICKASYSSDFFSVGVSCYNELGTVILG